MVQKKKDGLLKRGTNTDFELHVPAVGKFGGGTQPAEYRDENGKIVPFKKTKWYKKLLKLKGGNNA